MGQILTVDDYVKFPPGNYFRTWSTVEEVEGSGYRGMVWVRSRRPQERTWNMMNVSVEMLQCLSLETVRSAYFTEVPPLGTLRIIQGHITESTGILVLQYDRSQRTLRNVVNEGWFPNIEYSSRARLLLKGTLDPEDYEMLMDTLDQYPGCIVEFTMWEKAVGALGRRLCFWEVRNY